MSRESNRSFVVRLLSLILAGIVVLGTLLGTTWHLSGRFSNVETRLSEVERKLDTLQQTINSSSDRVADGR